MPQADDPTPAEPEGVAALTDGIGETLRRAFDKTAAEPLPEAFEALLRRLR